MKKTKMTEDARKARNAYYRSWRANNQEKVKQAQEKYWAKKAAEIEQDKAAKNSSDC